MKPLLNTSQQLIELGLKGMAGAYERQLNQSVLDLHVILENSSTHKTAATKLWLEKHPRFTLHFRPTRASRLTQWKAGLHNWKGERCTEAPSPVSPT